MSCTRRSRWPASPSSCRCAASTRRTTPRSRWRLEMHTTRGGLTVLNDAYNANPASMDAALRALAHTPTQGRRVAVLGDMLELGAVGPEAHAAVCRRVA